MANDNQGTPEAIPQGAQIGNAQPDAGAEAIPQGAQIGALSPDEQASQTRQMLVSGLTGMPTPNMTEADKAQFQKGKAAGAVSVPLVAGATMGLTGLSELAMPFAEHISGKILEHGTELATKYPNFVKLASKLAPSVPFSTLAALTYIYEHFKK
jgi:hypothetical protein